MIAAISCRRVLGMRTVGVCVRLGYCWLMLVWLMAVIMTTCCVRPLTFSDRSLHRVRSHAISASPVVRHRSDSLVSEADVVVIGSGVGGLSCGGLLAKYGFDVSVLEAHGTPGGCAHGWTRGNFHFDSGASLFFGISNRDLENPLTAVLALLNEEVQMRQYSTEKTRLYWNDAVYDTQIGCEQFNHVIADLWGEDARQQWTQLQDQCRQRAALAASIHPMAVRYDNWIGLTAVMRAPLTFFKFLLDEGNISSTNFSSLVDNTVQNPKLKEFVNILCQGTSGLGSDDILSSYMIRAFNRLYQTDSQWEIPIGGSQSIVNALIRGLRKHGGRLHLRSRVRRVLTQGNRAVGVELSSGKRVFARKAVVSNATVWDTAKLISEANLMSDFRDYIQEVNTNASFMHLHMAIKKEGLPSDALPLHTFIFDKDLRSDTGWPTICIPTVVDDSLAPNDFHLIHAYMTEPYETWSELKSGSADYEDLKEAKTVVLMNLVKRLIPDVDERISLQLAGSPLTHERFLNKIRGTYGAKNLLKVKTTPKGIQPLKNMYCIGDSTFPGTGTPAVAASAMWVSNTIAPIHKHWTILDELQL